jgi:hypothetical protein
LNPTSTETPSLLLEIEGIVVKFLVQRAKMNKPLTSTEALSFINSLIKDSDIVLKIIAFREQRKVFNGRDVAEDKKFILSKGYYRGFLKRKQHLLKTSEGTRLDENRARWTTCANFLMMYELIYKNLYKAGVAGCYDVARMYNEDGIEVFDEAQMVG